MTGKSSNTTLHTLATVADRARITRQTLYTWLKLGVVDKPKYDVDGRPVFTKEEMNAVLRAATDRRGLFEQVRLSSYTD